jgi:hypothetical protein
MSADDVYALTAYIPALNGMVRPGSSRPPIKGKPLRPRNRTA